jgi:hypothetical protein
MAFAASIASTASFVRAFAELSLQRAHCLSTDRERWSDIRMAFKEGLMLINANWRIILFLS